MIIVNIKKRVDGSMFLNIEKMEELTYNTHNIQLSLTKDELQSLIFQLSSLEQDMIIGHNSFGEPAYENR